MPDKPDVYTLIEEFGEHYEEGAYHKAADKLFEALKLVMAMAAQRDAAVIKAHKRD